jgi:hypothetical protein
MSLREDHAHVSTLGPRRTTVMIEGIAALVGLAALSSTFFVALAWALVQLVRMLAA